MAADETFDANQLGAAGSAYHLETTFDVNHLGAAVDTFDASHLGAADEIFDANQLGAAGSAYHLGAAVRTGVYHLEITF